MAFLGISIVLLSAWAGWRYWRRQQFTIYQIEKQLFIREPVALTGRPDVVWRRGDNVLVVGDYKSRSYSEVFLSEIIQLSVYRLLLEKTQDLPVAPHGWIHFSGGRKQKIALLSAKEVVRLHKRYTAIAEGASKGEKTDCEAYCRFCSHVKRCR